MRVLLAACAIATLASPAMAESFNVTGMQVVTHRGSDVTLKTGDNYVDRKNQLICTSDKGCSLVIQTQINFKDFQQVYRICTLVDGVEAAPPCQEIIPPYPGTVATFQGAPGLAKGTHTVQTDIWAQNSVGFRVGSYQLVYTLYQH